MSALPSIRSAVLLVAAVAVVTVASGVVVMLVQDADPFAGTAQPAQTRRAPEAQVRPEPLESMVPEQVKDFGRGGPGVTPTPPRILAIARATVPTEARHALARLKHVQKVTVVDAGAIKIAGTGLNLLAVNPVDFRSWTPKAVADEPAVWSALTRGELVAEAASARRLGMVLGAGYQVDGGPELRLAASAGLGLKGIDGIVSAETGRLLGAAQGVAVLLHGKEGKVGAGGVAKLLGSGTQVVALRGSRTAAPVQQQPPQQQEQKVATVGRPGSYLELYKQSATRCPGLSWTVLAAIGQVESGHGRNNGPSSAGALGPMQFMPATWKAYGVDGDGDGKKDIWSPYDAVPGAANYLCANGAGKGGEKLRKAIWFYNHSWSYVNKVMGYAEAYARAYT
ncbi:lytic transglycosylase domain-containing protein [Nonomuraea typhae]|uniref:lytic transglycosylase domain-containing protein n=1 Tax=Nonomuraea typhae TaxID=2603600 RepID=UPI0012FB31C7|nr:lytic transglycosylase domain-containing protein [Nonomuraea typhae]